MTRVHFGPANGPDGSGQATACGQNAANRWCVYTRDPKEVTCMRCLKTHEVRAVTADPADEVIDLMARLQDSLAANKRTTFAMSREERDV